MSVLILPPLPALDYCEIRHIPNWPGYAVTDTGEVWSCWKNSPRHTVSNLSNKWSQLKPSIRRPGGYLFITLTKNRLHIQRYVHILMLEIFVGPCPIGMEACHNNGKANDNILGNIRWDTHSKNILDKNLHGTGQQGEQNNRAKLKNKDIVIIKDMFQRGMTRKEIAEIFHVHRYTISRVLQGKTYAVLGMGTAVTINPSAK